MRLDSDDAGTRDPSATQGQGGTSSSRGSAGTGTGTTSNSNMAAGSRAGAGAGDPMNGSAAGSAAADGGTTPMIPGQDASPPGSSAGAQCTDGEERPCLLHAMSATDSEACNRGMQRCGGKVWGTCLGEPLPTPEQCNGIDDDCDAKVDEQSETDCFPDGQVGCAQETNGAWTCQGMCTVGKRTCTQGRLGDCAGFTAPSAEVCTAAGANAVDENCNGVTDEACACMDGEMRSCYSGSDGTINVGKCVAGTQLCSNGILGPCMNAVAPAVESCANEGADDDCNGAADNIPERGAACSVASNAGICGVGTLQCEMGKAELSCITNTPIPETCNGIDDDCNGTVDDPFNPQTDAMNCGGCGKVCASAESCCGGKCANTSRDLNNCGACGAICATGSSCSDSKCTLPNMPGACEPACAAGQTCCGGTCVDTKTNLQNCGMCGSVCTGTTAPGCCGGQCVDLVSITNCGQCGRDCSLLAMGGLTCMCTKSSSGTIACTGPLLDLCL